MVKPKQNVIIKVEKGSIAEELGIEPGDILISINDQPVQDVFDYRYLINDEYIEMCIKSTSGEEYIAEIEKEYNEDVGIVFESGLMDKAKSCSNKCIFCFIDQLPPNMRETLYFKDDDSRLSFLQGNYVTLTNMKEADINRIIYYHLSPINISVHTSDLELRKKMLKNKNAGNLINIMEKLKAAGIEMNLQVVLCNGINDGKVLDKTINDMKNFYPNAKSLSVVPIGLTKYRQNLHPMKPFSKEDSLRIVNQISSWQKRLKKEIGSAFVFISDEFYLKAEVQMPKADEYEDFPQLENGVGMITLFEFEFDKVYKDLKKNDNLKKSLSVATGKAAFDFINKLAKKIMDKFSNVDVNVYQIDNNFFGTQITVSGLLTGTDIIEQLKNKKLGDYLLLPENILKSGERVLLDDKSIEDIEKELNIPIRIVENSGEDFISAILNTEEIKK